ncbi:MULTISPECIES: MFS transporter [Sphingomonas]|uniref:MFS family permease n=2 Tax=Pseudomonadota TaxID=1224 RepID=A0A7X5V010_9SPHN|nr:MULTISPECIES: MFS transporter [Sphingomonas]MBN8812871.1 MFS transporter [Sphingomonas sp.]NIJ65065.1 MFS family permease [Sphingomonas leidyi]OJY51202.1 MAG: MFS transporter [Sphingomonas sp. 67-41]
MAEPTGKDIKLVIGASSLGTIFEWYDFFIWGTLTATGILQHTFFPAGNDVLASLLAWAAFAVGFGFRPLGAVLFGYLGDRMGRKYTFLVTITVMGLATAGIGLVPSYAAIGIAAPLLILLMRVAQGLALGGEYGGAAIYVAEHSPGGRAGFHTSFIQASVVGGFILSLAVVLAFKAPMPAATWEAWGWRLPFLFSILLLAISLWMRLKLSESPVFQAIKDAGETASNPFLESFTYPGNLPRLFVALFGIAAGLTVIWYTSMFSVLSFLTGPMRMDPTTAQLICGGSALAGCGFFILFGHLSDRIGRKKPIVIGYALTLVLLFPLFWAIGGAANPGLAEAAKRTPVVVRGPDCTYDPFAAKQVDACGRILDQLSKKGIAYKTDRAEAVVVTIGGVPVADASPAGLDAALAAAGYRLERTMPSAGNIAVIVLAILGLMALAGATYGPVAALLSEMFPSRIRYSSMSIPYHLGTGYFGGFLPFISQYIVARTGDPYAGLWYTIAVVAMALVVTALGLTETVKPPRKVHPHL